MHTWQFSRAGGFSQVMLDRGADFAALAGLDQKLWVALACPVDGVEFDPHTLALLDGDGDARIRAPELLAAIAWTLARLASPDELLADSPACRSLRSTPHSRPEPRWRRRRVAYCGRWVERANLPLTSTALLGRPNCSPANP